MQVEFMSTILIIRFSVYYNYVFVCYEIEIENLKYITMKVLVGIE